MARSIEEALAFVEVLSTGSAKVFFMARLGVGQQPVIADFAGSTGEAIERCEVFLQEVQDCANTLWAITIQARVRLEKAKAVERAEYLPGLAPEGQDSPQSDPEEQTRADSQEIRPDAPKAPQSPESVFRTATLPAEPSEPPKKRGPGRPSKLELEERERLKAQGQAAMPKTGFTPSDPPRGPAPRARDEWAEGAPVTEVPVAGERGRRRQA